MKNGWIPLEPDDEAQQGLIVETCRIIGCSHADSVILKTRRDRPRAVCLQCAQCGSSWFVKRFSVDAVEPEIRALRSAIEYDRLSELEALGLAEGSERFPKALGLLKAPHFAVVEEFIDSDELLETIHKAISGDMDPLYAALKKLAALLARLHAVRRSHRSIDISQEDPPTLNLGAAASPEMVALADTLSEEWRAAFLMEGSKDSVLVHDGFTPLNVLYSQDSEELVVSDVETVHVSSRFVDIGNTTAELKFTFALHSRNELGAEPFIAFFLREYFWLTKAEVSFAKFTFFQTYFMARGLFNIAKGKWLETDLRQWTLEVGLAVWATILKKDDICHPKFHNIRCVLFDFYNTLVEIKADDSDIANFEAVRQLSLSCFPGDVPTAVIIRDMYLRAIQDQFDASSEQHTKIDSERVWDQVLEQSGLKRSNVSEQDRHKLLSEVMLTFRKTAQRSFRVSPGAIQMISDLKTKSISVGVVSDAQRIYLEDEIARAGLSHLVDFVVISSDFGFRKPDRGYLYTRWLQPEQNQINHCL